MHWEVNDEEMDWFAVTIVAAVDVADNEAIGVCCVDVLFITDSSFLIGGICYGQDVICNE